jgi:outer membrane biosynthesis protein TonB
LEIGKKMAKISTSKKSELSSKKSEPTQTTTPKPEVTKPEASKSDVPKSDAPKTETSSTENPKVEKSESKSDAPPKSASQASISHFSSVSTPEYRSGWNAIFGGGQDKEKLKVNQDTLPTKIEISDEDIPAHLREALDQNLGDILKQQGHDLTEGETSLCFEYAIDCTINRK